MSPRGARSGERARRQACRRGVRATRPARVRTAAYGSTHSDPKCQHVCKRAIRNANVQLPPAGVPETDKTEPCFRGAGLLRGPPDLENFVWMPRLKMVELIPT